MEIKHDLYDVRFFGGHHMRANIEKIFIKPITASVHSLQVRDETNESIPLETQNAREKGQIKTLFFRPSRQFWIKQNEKIDYFIKYYVNI